MLTWMGYALDQLPTHHPQQQHIHSLHAMIHDGLYGYTCCFDSVRVPLRDRRRGFTGFAADDADAGKLDRPEPMDACDDGENGPWPDVTDCNGAVDDTRNNAAAAVVNGAGGEPSSDLCVAPRPLPCDERDNRALVVSACNVFISEINARDCAGGASDGTPEPTTLHTKGLKPNYCT